MLTEETGLVYFGARWYDPEIGRFISPDPEEDGENWYSYCENDPINYVDPDGRLSLKGWAVLGGGIWNGIKQYGPKKIGEVAKAIAIGSAIGVAMSAAMPVIAPILPGAIPVIASVMPYVSCAVMAATGITFIADIIDDLRFLVKEFGPVFLGRNPSDRKVRTYGVRLSKVGLEMAALITTQKGLNAIMKTGVLQKIGFKAANYGGKNLSINLKGKIGERTSEAVAKMRGEKVVGRQVSFTQNGTKVRVDIVTKNIKTGDYGLVEAKFGPGADLSANQKIVYPTMDTIGATVVGKKAEQAGLILVFLV
jgi:uncharacterized protein RhaS with RHS repeats